jgi:hypothetical protein
MMEQQISTRKSQRVKRKSVFLEDYVQSGVQLNDGLESLDGVIAEQPDFEGKYNTYKELFVQSGPPLTSFIAEQQSTENEGDISEDNSFVNSEMEEEVDDIGEEVPE